MVIKNSLSLTLLLPLCLLTNKTDITCPVITQVCVAATCEIGYLCELFDTL